MQKKIMYSLMALFITVTAVAQPPLYSVTTNINQLPEKEASVIVSLIPDKIATAFTLFVQNREKKKINLQISHQTMGVLVDTNFTSGQFKCRYNFEQVEDGRYQVTLISGKEKLVKDIEINTVTKRNVIVL